MEPGLNVVLGPNSMLLSLSVAFFHSHFYCVFRKGTPYRYFGFLRNHDEKKNDN